MEDRVAKGELSTTTKGRGLLAQKKNGRRDGKKGSTNIRKRGPRTEGNSACVPLKGFYK